MSQHWLQTLKGNAFDFSGVAEIYANEFDADEIATSLARTYRFARQTIWPYTVAQHSVLIARRFHLPLRFVALIYDAPEAVTCDMPSPVKLLLAKSNETTLEWLQAVIAKWICKRHGVDSALLHDDQLKREDLRALATEKRDLMRDEPREWAELPAAWPKRIEPWHPDYARDEWLSLYRGCVKYLDVDLSAGNR